MIILLTKSSDNIAASDALLREYPNETVYDNWEHDTIPSTDSRLMLLDINAETTLHARTIAKELVEHGLEASSITTIQLFISDLKPKEPILGFATTLCHEILKLIPKKTLTIVALSTMNSLSYLVPPNTHEAQWTLYAAPAQHWSLPSQTELDMRGRLTAYREYLTHPAFTGSLQDFLKKSTNFIRSEAIKQQYTEDEDLTYSEEHPHLSSRSP